MGDKSERLVPFAVVVDQHPEFFQKFFLECTRAALEDLGLLERCLGEITVNDHERILDCLRFHVKARFAALWPALPPEARERLFTLVDEARIELPKD